MKGLTNTDNLPLPRCAQETKKWNKKYQILIYLKYLWEELLNLKSSTPRTSSGFWLICTPRWPGHAWQWHTHHEQHWCCAAGNWAGRQRRELPCLCDLRLSVQHLGTSAGIHAILNSAWWANMDTDNLPWNMLIVGPTNSGKTLFLMNQLCSPFYMVLICKFFHLVFSLGFPFHIEFSN